MEDDVRDALTSVYFALKDQEDMHRRASGLVVLYRPPEAAPIRRLAALLGISESKKGGEEMKVRETPTPDPKPDDKPDGDPPPSGDGA